MKLTKNWFAYLCLDPESPSGLTWAIPRGGGVAAGDNAGGVRKSDKTSYYQVKVNGKKFLAHRIVWEMANKQPIPSGMQIDHIDRNGLNNKIENLRLVTAAVNSRNKSKQSRKKVGGDLPCGVTYEPREKRFVAKVYDINGNRLRKCFHLSRYGEEQALKLAQEWRAKAISSLNSFGAGYTVHHGQ